MVKELSPNQISGIDERPRLRGIFLFVKDPEENALFFENLETKVGTQKVAGQLSTPAETRDPGERLWPFIRRTIREELGQIKGEYMPHFRGAAILGTPEFLVSLYCFEIPTIQSAVVIDPEDKHEMGSSLWIPINEIDNREIIVGGFRVPQFRSPIPQFARNVQLARESSRRPTVQYVESDLPSALFPQKQKSGAEVSSS